MLSTAAKKLQPPQFEVETQIEAVGKSLTSAMLEAQNALARFQHLFDEQQRQFRLKQDEQDQLEIYTEPEAAAKLKIKPAQLARLRQSENLPFVRAGAFVRYSKENLAEIVKILTVNE